MVKHPPQLGDPFTHLLSHLQSAREVGTHQQDRKLLIANAAKQIIALKLRAGRMTNIQKHLVSSPVAPAVVDLAEIVDVEVEQAQRQPFTPGTDHLLLAELKEGTADVKPGHRALHAHLPQLQFTHHQVGHERQQSHLLRLKAAGLFVDDAQGAQVVALRRLQGGTGVKADPGLIEHQGIAHEARILTGIGNHKDVVAGDGVGAERHAARCFNHIQPMARQKPLTVLIHQRHQCDRHVQHGTGQPHQPIEVWIGGCIQQGIPLQIPQPLFLIGGDRVIGERHGSAFLALQGHQAYLAVAQVNAELITGLEIQHVGVRTAHHQVAVEMHVGAVAQIPAMGALAMGAASVVARQCNAGGLQQRLIERAVVQMLLAIGVHTHIAAMANKVRAMGATHGLNHFEQTFAFEHGWGAEWHGSKSQPERHSWHGGVLQTMLCTTAAGCVTGPGFHQPHASDPLKITAFDREPVDDACTAHNGVSHGPGLAQIEAETAAWAEPTRSRPL